MNKKRCITVFILLLIMLALAVAASIATGSVRSGAREVVAVLFGRSSDTSLVNIIWQIRIPRALAAVLLGGSLALSGYMLQTFFDNPIVGPFVLGISSGAKLTVAVFLIFFISAYGNPSALALVAAAFVGAMAAMGFVLLISLKAANMGILVVCGIMTGYICSAATDLLVTFADDSNIVNLHNWSMGSLSGIGYADLRIIAVIVVVCLVAAFFMSKPIGAYRLGEAYAMSAGVNITLLRISLILVSSILAANVTAFAGPISFVGIAVPHLFKNMAQTTRPAVMIPGCFFTGALITLVCDMIARTIFAPAEVSVSSVTAVFLVPVVIVVMIRRRKNT